MIDDFKKGWRELTRYEKFMSATLCPLGAATVAMAGVVVSKAYASGDLVGAGVITAAAGAVILTNGIAMLDIARKGRGQQSPASAARPCTISSADAAKLPGLGLRGPEVA